MCIKYSLFYILFALSSSFQVSKAGFWSRTYDIVADISCSTFYSECCRPPYLRKESGIKGDLVNVLKTQYFGQHIAVEAVTNALIAHLRKEKPRKPLVLSFHGWAGSGKSYLAELIIQALYQKGTQSKYVRMYTSSVDFPDKNQVMSYKKRLQEEVRETLKSCEHALFLFEEVEDAPPTLFDALVGFLDRLNVVKDVNHTKAIYIFVSNIGASEINRISLKAWKEGRLREDLTITDFHDPLSKEAFYSEDSGMAKTRMIDRVLVDYLIPFLPMELRHVSQCAAVELQRHGEKGSTIDPESIAKNLTYWPSDVKLYSNTGCKRVMTLVDVRVVAEQLKDEL